MDDSALPSSSSPSSTHPYSFSQLLQAISDPSSSEFKSVDRDVLLKSLDVGVYDAEEPSGRSMREFARKKLEEEFLRPIKDLSSDKKELGLWQMINPVTVPIPSPTLSPLEPTHTVIPLLRGLDGEFSGWREIYAPPPAPLPTASSSMDRAPGGGITFVRGKGSYVPFKPGGMEEGQYRDTPRGKSGDGINGDARTGTGTGAGDEADEDEEERKRAEDEDAGKAWKTIAPGMKKGMQLTGADVFLRDLLGEEAFSKKVKRRKRPDQDQKAGINTDSGLVEYGSTTTDRGSELWSTDKSGISPSKDVDDLLPISRLPIPPFNQKSRFRVKKEWAHAVDVNQPLLNFHELVPEMARKYPFELDTFQKEAVYHLEMGDSVFVAAHTSAGKTVVAEYAIALAEKHLTRAIYTSPIKALSNQKFRDFKTTFDPNNIGILTGDVQINPEGSCLIMTTEILRSMLYKGADLIRDVEFVIFDEVHYVNDAERGVVWEEVIIMLPEHVNIILLSATVPNTMEFASWVGRTKKKDIYVISTPKRPVPLEHFLWAGQALHKIVDSKGQFLGDGYKAAGEALRRKQDKEREAAGLPPLVKTGGRGMPARGGAKSLPTGRGQPMRGGGRGGPPVRGGGRGGNTGTTSYGAKSFGGAAFDRQIWVQLVQHLRKIDLLPVVVFTFSKKRCEENAGTLSSQDLCVASEKSEIHVVIEKALTRLKGSDKKLPQITRIRDLLLRGIGVHHGGLLPIVKEMVEVLFARGLVKVLFATETFAMGVNMPAKSVVFSGIRKHDGHSFRTLLPGEYTQMAGRAGRRGLDTTGTVIIIGGDELPDAATLNEMMLGVPNKLISQFRLTYNMILNLLRVEALKVEEMIKRSFSENASQSLAPEQQKQIERSEKALTKLATVDCAICSADIEAHYDVSAELSRLQGKLMDEAAHHPQANKAFAAGRVVLLYDKHFRGNIGVILRPSPGLVGPDFTEATSAVHRRTYWVLTLVSEVTKSGDDDFESVTAPPRWPVGLQKISRPTWQLVTVSTDSISLLVDKVVKVNATNVLDKRMDDAIDETLQSLVDLPAQLLSLEEGSDLPEIDWTRMRSLDFQEGLRNRNSLRPRIAKMECRLCGDFDEHYEILHERKLAEADLQQLRLAVSDQNLELLPDYEQRVEVLKELQFIDENSTVLLKGRVACEINSADELVLTELILENTLAQFTPEEAVALLSVFVFVEKTTSVPEIPMNMQDGLAVIYDIADRVERVQDAHKVPHEDFRSKFKPGLVEVVYEWAKGMPFNQITDLTDVPEGTIVRVITRLDETCREVRDAARVVGDRELFVKMEQAQALIKRDIVFAASLYF